MTNAPYDQIATWYDEQVRSALLTETLILPHYHQLLDKLSAQTVCDVDLAIPAFMIIRARKIKI